MRALRVLGLAEDGRNLVCEDGTSGELFTVPADERLRAATRGDLSRLGQLQIELEPQLRPREIQARIRAGATIAQVATAANTSVGRIERYAYPVLLERSTTAEKARLSHPIVDGNPTRKNLEELVMATLGDRGQDSSVQWDAYREDDNWVVALRWQAGRSENSAHWEIHSSVRSTTVHPRTRPPGADGSLPSPTAHHRRPQLADVARRITDAAQATPNLQPELLPEEGPADRRGQPGWRRRRRPVIRPVPGGHWPTGWIRSTWSSRPSSMIDPGCSRRPPPLLGRTPRQASGPVPTTPPAVGTERVSDRSCPGGKTSCSAADRLRNFRLTSPRDDDWARSSCSACKPRTTSLDSTNDPGRHSALEHWRPHQRRRRPRDESGGPRRRANRTAPRHRRVRDPRGIPGPGRGWRPHPAGWNPVRRDGILHQGGTVIGTARSKEFRTRDGRRQAARQHGRARHRLRSW